MGDQTNGVLKMDVDEMERSLLSSSTKRRVATLGSIERSLENDEYGAEELRTTLALIFATYPRYIDRKSRLTVQNCLAKVFTTPNALNHTSQFLELLKTEAKKSSIAPANAFVLVEWFSVLIAHFAKNPEVWEKHGIELVKADASALETCLASEGKTHIKQQALWTARRGVRRLLKTRDGLKALPSIVEALTAKGTASTARNAPFLGVVAGVSARIPDAQDVMSPLKKDYNAFFVREIIGSKAVVPEHVAKGLEDYFASFVTEEDLQKELVPALEKGLLRAPEVVLNDLISPLVRSLPTETDLSNVLQNNLLKPLMANVKSTSASIREGALRTFQALAARSTDETALGKVAEELANPLKAGKVSNADQKIIHAKMLSAIPPFLDLSKKVALAVTAAAGKEPNEAALEAETHAIARHVRTVIAADESVDAAVQDAFTKGVADKKPTISRIWALRFADLLWDVPALPKASTPFITTVATKMLDVYTSVVANPLPAAQSGLATVAYIWVALSQSRLAGVQDDKLQALIKKAAIAKTTIIAEPKPSFLLNFRVYTKSTSPADVVWAMRALASVADLASSSKDDAVKDTWSQGLIYFITAAGFSHTVRKEASQTLSKLYLRSPVDIRPAIINGIWQWRKRVDVAEKDTAALAAKTGNHNLYLVIKSLALSVEEQKALTESSSTLDKEVVSQLLVDTLILCHKQLLPHTDWIATCLHVGQDPGELVAERLEECIQALVEVTDTYLGEDAPQVCSAAYDAAADLAFVAPNTAIPRLVEQLNADLTTGQLSEIGSLEAAIFRAPSDTPYVDVLASKSQEAPLDKTAKDYDILKFEAELRAQIAQKKGPAKKLTKDEQEKVNTQLKKEAAVRKQVAQVDQRLRRGIGFIHSLATTWPTEAEMWIVQAVDLLSDVIEAGAGLVVGDAAALAYLDCAESVSQRLGPMRRFIGVATLRAIGVTQLPAELLTEPLQDLVTRILYRLRFLGEQRPFDTVTLAYILPLVFLVLQNGGFAEAKSETADEQLLLALEFLATHTEVAANERLPRKKILNALLAAIRRYTQHYKLIKDCLQDFCHNLEPTIAPEETAIILRGAIVPEATVRTAVLQAIDAELDMSDLGFAEEIWLACHDDAQENVELARTIWEESEFNDDKETGARMLPYLASEDRQLRRAAARSLAASTAHFTDTFKDVVEQLRTMYAEKAKPVIPEKDQYGMVRKKEVKDPWESRSGIAMAFRELADCFETDELVGFLRFLVDSGPLADRHDGVRDQMIEAATTVISVKGAAKVEELMEIFESALEGPDRGTESDKVNEAVIILYGALARHLEAGDQRVPNVVQRLLSTLSTPSETVQYAVASCLPPLVRTSSEKTGDYVQQMMDELLNSKKYASRRGAAYGLAGIVLGRGIHALREFRIMSTLAGAIENKKDSGQRQGGFLAYELLAYILGPVFEPYVIQIVPQLIAGFGDANTDVRDACLDAAKTCFSNLSSYGVKQILPTLLEGLDETQWRSKKGACDSLGAMAYLDPNQLALSLPEIIPPLTTVLTDSHKEVRAAANRALQRFGEVISNPEIKGVVNVLLKALSDPTKYTDEALDSLTKINFLHFLDAPSLALVVRILERGLGERSATKRKAAQIIGSLAHLTERKDLISHLPILVAGLRLAIVDPVPTTRATASKALGSLIEKLGEDALPDLIPSLMTTLKSDTGAGDRLGSAQALSEVLAGLGTTRLEETLPTILQNVASSKAAVREGFMTLFIFLPACFGNSFSNYLSKIIPPILTGLADDVESIRETALRAGRLLVKNFATKAIDLLLPELERGLADDNYRIRLSSVELVGDLLFNLTGITAKAEQDEVEESAAEAGQSLLEVLGEERRSRVLSAIYICRCDTSGLVRAAAITVWKALVATPRTLKEIVPTLVQLIIRRLASSNVEQKEIAGNALGELIRKAGDGVMSTLLPTLEEGLHSTDTDAKQGICIALRELISSASPESLEEYEKTLIQVVRTALVDSNAEVREAAAEAFDSLQKILGKKAVDQVLPNLLSLLRSEDDAENALAALLTLLNDPTRSNIILPNLLPTLLTTPMSAFNARAVASLAEVAGTAMTRRLPNTLNTIMDNIVKCKDEELKADLKEAFDGVLLSIDEYDGLNTAMATMLQMAKNADHRIRANADMHLATFFEQWDGDMSRYYPDVIRALLLSFDDSDADVVKAAWTALTALTSKRLKKEDMEGLVQSTRQILQQVGVAGHNLRGFELPKGINSILPIFLHALMNGTSDHRVQAALAIADVIDRSSGDALKPYVTTITGPLIRVISERSVEVRSAILYTLNALLEKIPTFLKPFLPQLQRTFAKALADTSSETLRIRAAKALGTLITLTPRVDPLIAELVTGSKTQDTGVKTAMLKALYEVVSKAGQNMNEASRNTILGLIDTDTEGDDTQTMTNAKLLGALIKVLPGDVAASLIKNRVLTTHFSKPSILGLNAILAENPETLTESFGRETVGVIAAGIRSNQPPIAENAILAAGKYLLTPSSDKSFDAAKPLFEALAGVIPPGQNQDSRRLALVVVRTVARTSSDLIRPHLTLLTPPVFASVRDMVIPVKLAAEACFLAIFEVVDEEDRVFNKYMTSPAVQVLPQQQKRLMMDYFKRVGTRLAAQARERREAEGGAGGLGLAGDELDDEREVWSVGRVDLGTASFEE